jgi:hypothetical protein
MLFYVLFDAVVGLKEGLFHHGVAAFGGFVLDDCGLAVDRVAVLPQRLVL